jgi:hypothetical protein
VVGWSVGYIYIYILLDLRLVDVVLGFSVLLLLFQRQPGLVVAVVEDGPRSGVAEGRHHDRSPSRPHHTPDPGPHRRAVPSQTTIRRQLGRLFGQVGHQKISFLQRGLLFCFLEGFLLVGIRRAGFGTRRDPLLALEAVIFVVSVAQEALVEAVVREKGQQVRPEGCLGHGKHCGELLVVAVWIWLVERILLFQFSCHPLGNSKRIRRQHVQLLEVDCLGSEEFVRS